MRIIFERKKGDESFAIQNVAIPSEGNGEIALPLHNIIVKPKHATRRNINATRTNFNATRRNTNGGVSCIGRYKTVQI